ncbi:MAG: helix-turn-helix transcriptional regulator [Gammaproteobacteria bacterium]|nr:helix-turn-helix transcriptional regulator [Gammaproteobacteria bacterium]MCP5198409.1 helix-turn-helix transcriptional regulator [Gammaproteobacteria bacterium]
MTSRTDPAAAAAAVYRAHAGDRDWLDAFSACLDRHRAGQALSRILAAWGLSQAEAARLFGVTRQALAKWLDRGPPAERAESIADLAAATDLLLHYLKRERIPAVVRRAAPALGGRSLLDLLGQGRSRAVLEACRDMFAFEHG